MENLFDIEDPGMRRGIGNLLNVAERFGRPILESAAQVAQADPVAFLTGSEVGALFAGWQRPDALDHGASVLLWTHSEQGWQLPADVSLHLPSYAVGFMLGEAGVKGTGGNQ